MSHSVGEPPASSTPSLSRSSSISGADNGGLHTSIISQVHTRENVLNLILEIRNFFCTCLDLCSLDGVTLGYFRPQDDSLDHSLSTMTMSVSMSGTNLYEAARLSGGSSIIENLQSQLKLREGEIAQLQVTVQNKPTESYFCL